MSLVPSWIRPAMTIRGVKPDDRLENYLWIDRMDLLTHLFLPLTVAYVLWPERFRHPEYAALAAFGIGPDVDKFLGTPGLLHSLVTLVPIVCLLVAVELTWRRAATLSGIVAAFLASHLVLDVLAGGRVPLLYPFVETGVGMAYPIVVEFGAGAGVAFQGSPAGIEAASPRPDRTTYRLINGYGITSLLVFLVVVIGRERQRRRA